MSYRSGSNQVNSENASPIRIFNQTTTAVNQVRNTLPITLPSGSYKCSLSYRFDVTATGPLPTGSISLSFIESGLSESATASVPIAPMPLTSSIVPFGDGLIPAASIAAGTGFTEFCEVFISLAVPTTIYLFNISSFASTGAPIVTFTQSVTFTQIIG